MSGEDVATPNARFDYNTKTGEIEVNLDSTLNTSTPSGAYLFFFLLKLHALSSYPFFSLSLQPSGKRRELQKVEFLNGCSMYIDTQYTERKNRLTNKFSVNEDKDQQDADCVEITILPDASGKFGFNVRGGYDQEMPVIVSKVARGSPVREMSHDIIC